jgi:hypothetical protein
MPGWVTATRPRRQGGDKPGQGNCRSRRSLILAMGLLVAGVLIPPFCKRFLKTRCRWLSQRLPILARRLPLWSLDKVNGMATRLPDAS